MKKKHDLKNSLNRFFKGIALKAKLSCLILLMLGWHITVHASLKNQITNLNLKGKTIKEALLEIEENSEFRFIYENEKLDLNKTVNIDVIDESIEEILQQIFSKESIDFSITKNNLILIKPTQATQVQETITVNGKVSDSSGAPLPGVTVIIKGSTVGTITDMDGNYTISKVPSDAVLQFSFIGMTPQDIPLDGKTSINVTLTEDAIGLEEVVAVGYGIQKKATLSGSVANVTGEDLIKTPATNVSQGIAGRLPGVVALSEGGEPGYDGTTIRIRGVNTFGNADPLIVVDGVPGRSLDRIDPSTIESMSVLKDASAAIYGAQAANGVIIITTKRGSVGKPTVNISYNQGYSRPTVIPEMANAAEYGTLLNEIDYYAGRPNRYTDEEIQKYSDGSDPWRYPNTDWFDETLKPWSATSFGNVSIDGGSENFKYFVSVSEKSQDAFYRHSAANYNQYDLKSNLDLTINKYLNLYVNTTGRLEDRNYPTRSAENIFRMLMRSKPNSPAYWPNGLPGPDIEYGDNPVVICTDATGYNRDKRYIFNSDFGMNLKIPGVEGLTFKANASIDKTIKFQKQWYTPWYLYSWDGNSYDENGEPLLVEGKKGYDDPRLSELYDDSQRILLSGVLNYSKTFDNHTVNIMAGAERISNEGDNFNAYRRYFLSTAIDQLFAGGQDEINNGGSGFKEARLNYFGRLNYSFKDKYLAEFLWRYQGSYIFEKENRFGFFPGVSLGYVISEENFWKNNISFIDFAKIRASWGQTGNDRIDPFQYLAAYSFENWGETSLQFISNGGNTLSQALEEGTAPNSGVTWETATQKNIGVDLYMLNSTIQLTVDYFHNKRKDILWEKSGNVPYTSGLAGRLPKENIGRMKNQGIDFSINYRKNFNDLGFNVGFNGVYSKNKILYWSETPGRPKYQQSTGRPVDAELYYHAIGIFQNQTEIDNTPHWANARPGDIIFEDHDENGIIDDNDRIRYDKSRTPTFTGGLNFMLDYHNFDFTALFQGATGGVFYQTTESGDFGNYLKSFYDDRWTEDNPSNKHPRTYNRNAEYWINQRNTYWLHKTDYIRLKTLELGYTLPKSLTQRYLINNLRIYVSAFNLLTYSPDMDDYDPENTNGSGYNYPLNKVINIGASVTF